MKAYSFPRDKRTFPKWSLHVLGCWKAKPFGLPRKSNRFNTWCRCSFGQKKLFQRWAEWALQRWHWENFSCNRVSPPFLGCKVLFQSRTVWPIFLGWCFSEIDEGRGEESSSASFEPLAPGGSARWALWFFGVQAPDNLGSQPDMPTTNALSTNLLTAHWWLDCFHMSSPGFSSHS